MTGTAPPDVACPNCGAPVAGRYCATCGQEQTPDPTLRAFLGDLADDLFGADSRLWRTLRVLFTRPGMLSVEHRAGRRARYLAPTRLYLIASVLFFSAVAFAPVQLVQIGWTEEAESGVTVRPGSGVRVQTEGMPAVGDSTAGAAALIQRAERNIERLNDIFVRSLAWTMFLLIPIFAAMVQALFRGQGLLYIQHLVFALHYHAFAFLTQGAAFAAMQVPLVGQEAQAILLLLAQLANALYLYLALRRFYAVGRVLTVVRMVVLGFGYLLAISIAMIATVAVATLLL